MGVLTKLQLIDGSRVTIIRLKRATGKECDQRKAYFAKVYPSDGQRRLNTYPGMDCQIVFFTGFLLIQEYFGCYGMVQFD